MTLTDDTYQSDSIDTNLRLLMITTILETTNDHIVHIVTR